METSCKKTLNTPRHRSQQNLNSTPNKDSSLLRSSENKLVSHSADLGSSTVKSSSFLLHSLNSCNPPLSEETGQDLPLILQIKQEKVEPKAKIKRIKAPNSSSSGHSANTGSLPDSYLIDRYKYAVRHIRQGLSVEEACNKYRISKGALLKCLSGGTAPRGKKTRLTESEENIIVEWLMNNKDLKYNDAIHQVFEQVAKIFHGAQRPNPFHNGKPSMDWWYDFLSRHPQVMASKPEWLRRGKVNDQYIKDVQSGKLRCTKFRRALLSAIQYIRSLGDAAVFAAETATTSTASSQQAKTNKKFKSSIGNILELINVYCF